MKYRALAHADLVVSEIGFAVGAHPAADPLLTERLVRLGYDEGINLFLLPARAVHDPAVAAALAGPVRGNVRLAVPLEWPASPSLSGLESALDRRLAALATDRVDVLFLRAVPDDAVRGGALGDVVHRLRASGKVLCVGLAGDDRSFPARAAQRAGASVIDFDAGPCYEAPRGLPAEGISAIARVAPGSCDAAPALSFLWEGAGRTRSQALAALLLASPGICSVAVPAATGDELREAARAPLAPALTDVELAAARAVDRRAALAGV